MTYVEHPRARYVVVDVKTNERFDVLPTPLLLDESNHGPVEAYEDEPADEQYPALWRVREDAYDQRKHPGPINYRRVRVYRKDI